jgi:hypothetical protein
MIELARDIISVIAYLVLQRVSDIETGYLSDL